MKKFKDLSTEEFKSIVCGSKKLREKLYNRIVDSEMSFMGDRLDCIRDSLSDWSVGVCQRNYIKVRNNRDFVDGVKDSIRYFGCSDKLKKAVSHCKKLAHSNLFDYSVSKMADAYFHEELESFTDYIFDCYCEISKGIINGNAEPYIVCLLDDLAEYLWDEDNRMFYVPNVVSAA